jgi:hypothetical protein
MTFDHPFLDVAVQAERLIEEGAYVFQKCTCAGCSARQTMATANVFYRTGSCEECGHVTDIEAQGCNYVAVMGQDSEQLARAIQKVMEDSTQREES